jgi:leucyl-tRNA synthetase
MVEKYNPQEIEPRWQQKWEADGLNRSEIDEDKPKYYALTMYPYPSGDLHIGHWYAMAPSDARARWIRMRGYNVLFPMGFDSFGLPAENAAISRGIHPKEWTYRNIDNMRKQMRTMGTIFDWKRETATSDPEYYKWTQWFFLKFFYNDLAYRKEAPVDFCPRCNTTLAREQVWGEDRHCERCGTPVIKKDLEQWFFRITNYAEELRDHTKIDWPEAVDLMQKNWIGRSEGASVTFKTEAGDAIDVFTTRPDTLWGATFMVLAPEHPLVMEITSDEQHDAVHAYKEQAARQTDIEREAADREKTGVFTGGYAINPVNGERIPIWIADYVLMTYGSGAIMAVPAHDERDFAFALKFGLPIIPVIARPDGACKSAFPPDTVAEGFTAALDEAGFTHEIVNDEIAVSFNAERVGDYDAIAKEYIKPNRWIEVVGGAWLFIFGEEDSAEVMAFDSTESDAAILARCQARCPFISEARTTMEMLHMKAWYGDVLFHHEYGDMIHSGEMTGTPGSIAKAKVTEWLEEKGIGHFEVNYRLRDWLISRQRYWGAPIPIVYCDECGIVPISEDDLPVLLPDDIEFLKTGENPLKFHEGFVNTTCPECGGPAKRETDTMDTFMCSSWYQYRFLSPHYDEWPFDPVEGAYWLPVDQYTGGIEHATMHLMYTRFFTKAMRDCGIFEPLESVAGEDRLEEIIHEPMAALFNQGMILGEARSGDILIAEGAREDGSLIATKIAVVESAEEAESAGGAVAGEFWKRTEDNLDVRTFAGDHVNVTVTDATTYEIPRVGPDATIEDLRYHLEVEKMSKSKGNVIAPDEWVARYGADTIRGYLMFAFRWDQGGPWDSQGIQGVVRWLNDVWYLIMNPAPKPDGKAADKDVRALRRKVHQTIQRVTEGFETFSFNTAIAALMELKNDMADMKSTPVTQTDAWTEAVETMLKLMAPFTPFIVEELWAKIGNPYSIHEQSWPAFDPEAAKEESITLIVQVNGKVRDRIEVPAGISEEDAKAHALASEHVQNRLEGREPKKIIYVPGRLVNVVG